MRTERGVQIMDVPNAFDNTATGYGRLVLRMLTALLLLVFSMPLWAQQCEVGRPVVFADLNWDSNRIHTAVARYILEKGYGCQTDAMPGTSIPLVKGLARGSIDVMMEVWADNYGDAWSEAMEEGTVVHLGTNFPDAVQGWFVPRYLVEGDAERGIEPSAPDLVSISDLARYKLLFKDPERQDKGRFINCVFGWGCATINSRKLRAYRLKEHYSNYRPKSSEEFTKAIVDSYEQGRPFLAYYWGPTWILGKYDLVMLKEPAFNRQDWQGLNEDREYPKACAYPVADVGIAVSAQFQRQAPRLSEFLSNYETTGRQVSELLALQRDKGASAREMAVHFLSSEKSQWVQWVPEEVAAGVIQSLAE
ncbi:MAG: ABC transporter substrate-binding protein [Candidatus Sedimenticola sp. 6PFRAG5]